MTAKTAPEAAESENDALATPEQEALFERLQAQCGDEGE